jgi:hypothetical protein
MDNKMKNDRLFIQEIINDLEKNGYVKGGKASTMLRDWSGELREKTHLRGRTKKVFRKVVGKEFYHG